MNQMSTGKTELEHLIEFFRGSPAGRPDWPVVAKKVEEIRKSGKWRMSYASPTDWLDAAAKAYDVTPNTMRRFIAAARFLETKKDVAAIDLFAGGGLAIGVVELVKRMHDISPELAERALNEHVEGTLKFKEAKRIYDGLFKGIGSQGMDLVVGNPPWIAAGLHNANKLGVRRSYAERTELYDLINANLETFSGDEAPELRIEKRRFEYVSPDAVVIGRTPGDVVFLDGFVYSRPAIGLPRTAALKLIGEIGFASTFFRRFWIVLDANAEDAGRVSQFVEQLKLGNVGIALRSPTVATAISIIRVPHSRPVPDRQELIDKQVAAPSD